MKGALINNESAECGVFVLLESTMFGNPEFSAKGAVALSQRPTRDAPTLLFMVW